MNAAGVISLELARAIVAGRIRNQRMLLKRLERGRVIDTLADPLQRLKRLIRRAELAPDVSSVEKLMGVEGEAAALYWPALADLFGERSVFGGYRRRRKGEDPLNVVLDVLSSLLTRDIDIALERHGLNPGFGLLHGAEDREDALAYDLMEEFRAPVVEACALALFKRKALSAREHFEPFGQQCLKLNRDGWNACIRGYEAWVSRPVEHKPSGEKVGWRGLFELQAIALGEAIDTRASYQPYSMDY
jgi:CRISP-associated protein Cas1